MFIILVYSNLLYICIDMNRIHIISGIAIVTVALLLGTATIMSDQQSAFAHGYYYDHHNNNHRHGNDGSAGSSGSSWR